jgi:YbgC/YbaW family acyl-CoA thioester hydrolase
MSDTSTGVSAPSGPVLASTQLRVGLADVDGARLIYYAAPFGWAERLMSDWMAREVRSMASIFAAGMAFPCVHTQCTYSSPLLQDEVAEMELRLARIGRTSFTVRTDIYKADGRLGVTVESVHVFITGLEDELKPTPVPDWLRDALEGRLDRDTEDTA